MTTYLQDLAQGQKIESERRVVSAADIDAFCELSGDHNPLHTDDEHARAAGFAGRIAHGLLVLSIATGLRSEGRCRHGIRPFHSQMMPSREPRSVGLRRCLHFGAARQPDPRPSGRKVDVGS